MTIIQVVVVWMIDRHIAGVAKYQGAASWCNKKTGHSLNEKQSVVDAAVVDAAPRCSGS